MRLLPTVLSAAVLFGGATRALLAQESAPRAAEQREVEVRIQKEKPADAHSDAADRDRNGAESRDAQIRLRDANNPGARARVSGGTRKAERRMGPYLGVATSPPTPIVREQLKLSEGMGLVIEFIEKESPAEQAGLKRYDILTKLGDQLLVNAEQLAVLVRSKKPGDEVELSVVRGGAPMVLKAKLGERELPPLDDFGFFFHGGGPGGPEGQRLLEWKVRGMPPEIRDWWARHEPEAAARGEAGGNHAEGHAQADAHAESHGDAGDAGSANVNAKSRSGQTVTIWGDGDHTLTVTTESGKQHLVAKDRHGTVLFDGDLDAPGARDKLPAIVKQKLEKMEAADVKPPKAPEPGPNDAGSPRLPTDDANGV